MDHILRKRKKDGRGGEKKFADKNSEKKSFGQRRGDVARSLTEDST